MPSPLKISQLNNGNPAQSNDQIPINRSGTNFSITAGSIADLAPVPSFGTAGVGYFWGPGIVRPLFEGSIEAGTIATVADDVYVFEFVLENEWVISSASYMSDNGASGDYFGFGIYDLAGNALITTSFLSTATTGNTVVTNTFAPVTLPAGVYYFAQACDNAVLEAPVFAFTYSGQSAVDLYPLMNANSQPVAMLATNTMGANTGVMPATLGALTALTNQAIDGLGAVKWTP